MRCWLLFILFFFLVIQGKSQPSEPVIKDSAAIKEEFRADSSAFFSNHVQGFPAYMLLPEAHCRYYPFPSLLDPELAIKWPIVLELRKDGVPLKRDHWNDWLMVFLLIIAFLASAGLSIHTDVLQPLTWLIKKPSTYQERWRDDIQPVHILFNFVFCSVIGLVAWSASNVFLKYPLQTASIPVFITIVALVYVVKSVFYRTTGMLFGFKETLLAYLNIVFKINRCLALLILPLVFWMFFSTPFWSKWALMMAIGLFFCVLGITICTWHAAEFTTYGKQDSFSFLPLRL